MTCSRLCHFTVFSRLTQVTLLSELFLIAPPYFKKKTVGTHQASIRTYSQWINNNNIENDEDERREKIMTKRQKKKLPRNDGGSTNTERIREFKRKKISHFFKLILKRWSGKRAEKKKKKSLAFRFNIVWVFDMSFAVVTIANTKMSLNCMAQLLAI